MNPQLLTPNLKPTEAPWLEICRHFSAISGENQRLVSVKQEPR